MHALPCLGIYCSVRFDVGVPDWRNYSKLSCSKSKKSQEKYKTYNWSKKLIHFLLQENVQNADNMKKCK